jgi:membrane-associated protease RseP (regulator of RpoE activity)
MLLFKFVAAGALCLVVHLGAMAFLAHAFGITVRRVVYGVGPTLYANPLLQIKALPLSGHVKLKDSREEQLEPHERGDAFDYQALWKQIFIPLAGSASLVVFAVVTLGAEGWASFLRSFEQIFTGALSPFGAAQLYLQAFASFASGHSFVAVVALVATKLAALNLLPFGALNGGQALMTLVRFGRPKMKFEDAVTRWGIFLTLLLLVAWLLGAGQFFLRNAS